MGTGSVLPEVYTGDNMNKILRSFYDQFMEKTHLYKDYPYEKFMREYAMMTTVHFMYAVGMGAAIFKASAFENAQGARVELGGKGATEADLSPEELRQRMWWRKMVANYRENFKTFDHYELLKKLPENLEGLGAWSELPDHLR